MDWNELDRPIRYAIRQDSAHTVVPVKVYSMAPRWNGAALARTLTLFPNDPTGTGIGVDYKYSDVFDTKHDAEKEAFKRVLKGR